MLAAPTNLMTTTDTSERMVAELSRESLQAKALGRKPFRQIPGRKRSSSVPETNGDFETALHSGQETSEGYCQVEGAEADLTPRYA